MTTTVTALYDNRTDAQEAVRDLVNSGFDSQDINLIASDTEGEFVQYHDGDLPADGTMSGLGAGALLGGIGGFLVGLAAFAIPGVGPVLAAGPIAGALVGAGVGAATGGLIGALIDLGVDEDEAGTYAEGVRRGGTLVAVDTTEGRAELAVDVLERYDPVDIDERAGLWRDEGWAGYDPDAGAYTAEDVARERARYGETAGGLHYNHPA